MKICDIAYFGGKNIYSHKPVIKMTVDIGGFFDTPTKDIACFNDKLLGLLPGLRSHWCSEGREGGFCERLFEGTYPAHVLEHVILELQSAAGCDPHYGKTRLIGPPSTYLVVFESSSEILGMESGRAGAGLVGRLCSGRGFRKEEVDKIISDLHRIAVETGLGPSAGAIYDEAVRRGIPVSRVGGDSLLQLGLGCHRRMIAASLSDSAKCLDVDIAGNKHLSKQLLSDRNIPVPRGGMAYTVDSACALACEIGFPVVVKPYDGCQGKGVTTGIGDIEGVSAAFSDAFRSSRAVLVEKHVKGRDYRLLVVGDRVAAASERRPPSVEGDGVHSVRQLVEKVNADPLRGEDHEKPLTKIKLDGAAIAVLSSKGIDAGYVPGPGEIVVLRHNCNLSTGGTACDCTDSVHPRNADIAVRAAKALGLDIAGVDITAPDISMPVESGGGAVLEVNAAPGLRMHLFPTEGRKRNVASDIVSMLFPEGFPHSVPVVSITGTNGKTTTARLVKHILSLTGKTVGMTSTSGVYIGGECLQKGDNTGPVSARMVLSDPRTEAAVLETARGGIIRRGLGYDLADVGIVVNISGDHLGLDNINTLKELAFVKAVVVEAVKPGGYAVINADDAMAGYLMGRAAGRIMLFSRNAGNELLRAHKSGGGKCVFIEDEAIFYFDGRKNHVLLPLSRIPMTFGGMLGCNIENSLAAVSALFALNVRPEMISLGLCTFLPDLRTNPGRFNILDAGGFKVMLDYGHNAAGYRAVADFLGRMDAKRLTGVIGMPGDRPDGHIREVGAICGKVFSKIFIKEDSDLRGRSPGQVPDILYDSAIKSGMPAEAVKVVFSEQRALELAMREAIPGELVVMFYEELEPAVDLVNRLRQGIGSEADGLVEQEAGEMADRAG